MSSDDLVVALFSRAIALLSEWTVEVGDEARDANTTRLIYDLRVALAAKPEPGLDALTQAVTDALAVTGYVLIDETSGLPGTEPAFARALASRLTPDEGANR